MKTSLISALMFLALCFTSCKKENNQLSESEGSIQLGISLSQQSTLKSLNAGESPAAIMISIADASGKAIIESKKVTLIHMNGSYLSEPLSLTTGNYSITKFVVLNSFDSPIYATPLKGSKLAYLVNTPLPLAFSISKDIVTKINPEVISSKIATFEDFGYDSFSFDVVPTFDFLASIMIYNEDSANWELTSANMIIKDADGKTAYSNALAAITNLVTLRDNSSSFSINVTKDGYKPYALNISASDLKLFFKSEDNGPLIIKLFAGASPLMDIDGNIYHTVQIGTQVWMVENLRVTKFNDGTPIPLVTDNAAWGASATPAYSWYNNDEATFKNTYGALYNWYAVNKGNLCPAGWHVPTDAEWATLNTFLGGTTLSGGKLKESGTLHWSSPNAAATNETGFTALPTGSRAYSGQFLYNGIEGFYWSATSYSETVALGLELEYGNGHFFKPYAPKLTGMAVRCIKD